MNTINFSDTKVSNFGNLDSDNVILVLQGGPGIESKYLTDYMSAIKEKFHVLSYEYASQDETKMSSLVLELKAIIKSLKGKKIHLLAHSFGAALAIEYLKEYSKDIASNIFISWIYNGDWFKESELLSSAFEEKILNSDLAGLSAADLSAATKNDFVAFAPLYFPPSSLEEGTELLKKLDYRGEVFFDLMKNYLPTFDLKSILSSIDRPTLSILGKSDALVNLEYIKKGCEEISNVDEEEFEGAGHFPFLDFPDRFNQSVISFVENRQD